MAQTQYRLSYNGQLMVTGYTWDEACTVQATLAQEFPGIVALEAYQEEKRIQYSDIRAA